jgi:hypothetical protein
MFRIIQFKVDREKLLNLAESRESTVRRLNEIVDFGTVGDDWYTEPMSTTSAKAFEVEGLLRSLFGDRMGWDFVDLSAKYRLLRTRAPQAYDYGYVIEIGRMDGEFGEERLVAMPKDRVEYQSGRYASGMYSPTTCD